MELLFNAQSVSKTLQPLIQIGMLRSNVLVQIILAQICFTAKVTSEVLALDMNINNVVPQAALIGKDLFADRALGRLIGRVLMRALPRRLLDDHVDDGAVSLPTIAIAVVIIAVDEFHMRLQTLLML